MDKCIKCGNSWDEDEWTFGDWECDGDSAWQRITCNKCGFAWNCVYIFSHHEDAETLELLDDDITDKKNLNNPVRIESGEENLNNPVIIESGEVIINRIKLEWLAKEAEEAFWGVVAQNVEQAKAGDLDPYLCITFSNFCRGVVKDWIITNVVDNEDGDYILE